MERISIFNYEAFYLDFLEGNLNEEDTALLFDFLEAHPELKLEDDSLLVLNTEQPVLEDTFKASLKQISFVEDKITAANAEQFMIAETEGLLSTEKIQELDSFIGADSSLRNTRNSYRSAHLKPDYRVVYSDKNSLKKDRKIIWWPYVSMAAAACVAAIFVLWNTDSDPLVNTDNNYFGQNTKGSQTEVTNTEDPAVNVDQTNQNIDDQNAALIASVNSDQPAVKTSDIESAPRNYPAVGGLSLNNVKEISNSIDHQEIEQSTPRKTTNNNVSQTVDDYSMVGFSDMKNPIKPITNRLADVVKQEVDFRTAKPSENRSGGFYLKIGKFELSHRKF
jgi:hypothetical protein